MKQQKRIKKINKIYYGACEGLQEELYFNHLSNLINNETNSVKNVVFKFINNEGGSPLSVCTEAKKSLGIQPTGTVVAIFDNDFKDDSFIEAIKFNNKNKIIDGYSNINFDLWLVLHKTYTSKPFDDPKSYVKDIKKLYGLKDKDDIKSDDVIKKILEQITLDDVKNAINNAEKLEQEKIKNKDVYHNLEGHYNQPYVKIHKFIKNILDNTFPNDNYTK